MLEERQDARGELWHIAGPKAGVLPPAFVPVMMQLPGVLKAPRFWSGQKVKFPGSVDLQGRGLAPSPTANSEGDTRPSAV